MDSSFSPISFFNTPKLSNVKIYYSFSLEFSANFKDFSKISIDFSSYPYYKYNDPKQFKIFPVFLLSFSIYFPFTYKHFSKYSVAFSHSCKLKYIIPRYIKISSDSRPYSP